MDSMQYSNKTNGTMYFLVILVSLALGFGGGYLFFNKMMQNAPSSSTAVSSLNTALRKLWSDHVFWTRDYIIAAVADSPDAKAASERLLKNQEDLGNAVAKYYGKDAGNKLTDLLKQHILISVDVVAAAKANDKAKLEESDKRWHQNADEIAVFLSSANPNWPKKDMQDMMYDHLKLTTDEAVARIKKDWQGDIAAFDKVYDQILAMADGLTDGIAKQFPDKF